MRENVFGFYCYQCKERFLYPQPTIKHLCKKNIEPLKVITTNDMIDTYINTGSPIEFLKDKSLTLEFFCRFSFEEHIPLEIRMYWLHKIPLPIPINQ